MQNQSDEAEYEEFLEDFSDSKLTDEEVQEILNFARQTSNIKLRRLAKEVQHWRSFLPVLLEIVKDSSEKDNQIVKLADFWIRKNK
ncbi:MAG TPA: hypothetical protein PKY59_20360 [Pyrinomonadaceae bacterium]|nr:hypothetical protein [Pyrinomonadaceae bacterium]